MTPLCVDMLPLTESENGPLLLDHNDFQLGSVHTSLGNLVAPGSREVPTPMPHLVWTHYRHSTLQPRAPGLEQSSALASWVAGTTGKPFLLYITFGTYFDTAM